MARLFIAGTAIVTGGLLAWGFYTSSTEMVLLLQAVESLWLLVGAVITMLVAVLIYLSLMLS